MTSQKEFLKLLRQVHLRFAKFYSKKIASRRVTPPQYMMLMILLEEGDQKMHDLADFLRAEPASHPADGRVVPVVQQTFDDVPLVLRYTEGLEVGLPEEPPQVLGQTFGHGL